MRGLYELASRSRGSSRGGRETALQSLESPSCQLVDLCQQAEADGRVPPASDCRQNEKDYEDQGFGRGVPFHLFAKSRDIPLRGTRAPDFCTMRDALPAGSGSEQSPCDELPFFILCGVYANLRPVPGGGHEGDVRLLCSLWSPLCASLLT